jgi:parvulin-like peptidyl-prolyl isomerase
VVASSATGFIVFSGCSSKLERLLRVVGAATATALLCVAGITVGCGDDEDDQVDTGPAEEARHGLTSAQAGEVLVKVGDTTITVGEFADRLADQSPYLRARYNSPERRREFLDNLVRFELLAAEARRQEYDALPEVLRAQKQVMIQQMMKDEFEDSIQLSDITDEEIRAYYDGNRSEFQKPEQVRASHILIKNRAAAQRTLQTLLGAEADVALFRRTAESTNEDPDTRDRFGDLRFFSRPDERGENEPEVPAAVAEAAFAIERIGNLHRTLVETDRGFHIVKLTGRRAALHRTLEEARRPIQNRLWRERREQRIQEFIDRLRREAQVEEDLELLDQVRVEIPEGGASPTGEPAAGTPGPHPNPFGPGGAPIQLPPGVGPGPGKTPPPGGMR